ncbi:MAG: putative sugar O-methyltransferase [Acidobacteriota bacterium]
MTQTSASLQRLRDALPAMQAQRDALPADSVFRPSAMWKDLGDAFNFIFDLSDHHLQNIRIHTSLMTGVAWFANFQSNSFKSDEDKLSYPMIRQYHDLTCDIPERFWASEPSVTSVTEMVGIRYKGRLITDDLLRYQRCVSNLHWTGVYRWLDGMAERPVIVELGAGYGGLAHQIVSCFGRPCTYLIFDLPEMLYWSAAFLIVNNPGKRFHIDGGSDSSHASLEDICAENDFVFLPSFKFDRIQELQEMALFVNLMSFQEMSDRQIEMYLSLAAEQLKGPVFSENFSRHPANQELAQMVDDHLARWFTLTPDPVLLHHRYPNANAFDNPDQNLVWQLFPYVGTPKYSAVALSPVDTIVIAGAANERIRL